MPAALTELLRAEYMLQGKYYVSGWSGSDLVGARARKGLCDGRAAGADEVRAAEASHLARRR